MPPSNVAWGIEIGAGAIKGVKLVADGDSVQLADLAIVPHNKVLSTPDLDLDDAMRIALGQLNANYDLSGAQIAISIPGHQSFARFAKLPPVEPKKVPDIVKFEAVQQIPFPLEDVEWDYQTFVSPDSPDVEVGIFAVTRQRIMEKLQQLGEVGITPDLATISPVAAYNALAYDLGFTEDTPGTIILDIGTTATDMIVAEKGRVWTSAFPIGGHQFTDALVAAFKLSYSKAERLKREAEQTKHARHAFQAMRPVFTDLVQELQRRIGSYTSSHPGSEVTRLIGLGSTFALPGLRKYLKQQLQMDVYRLEEFKRLKAEGPAAEQVNARSLELATAYGLALQCLGKATLEANLMPVKVVRDAMWKRKRVWFGMAAGVAAAATASMFVRPLLDEVAYSGAERPTNINTVVSTAQRLSSRVSSEGLDGAGGPDFRAAQIIELFDGRDVAPAILNDVAGAVVAARRGAQNASASASVELVSMSTAFTTPSADGGGQNFGDPFGGGGRDQRGGTPADVPLEGEEPGVDLSQTDHVLVTMRFTIAGGANVEQAVRAGLEAWAQAARGREGGVYAFATPEEWVESVGGGGVQNRGRPPVSRGDRDGRGGPPNPGRDRDRPDPIGGGTGAASEAEAMRELERLAPLEEESDARAQQSGSTGRDASAPREIEVTFGVVPNADDAAGGFGGGA